jgi:hypothetical protein
MKSRSIGTTEVEGTMELKRIGGLLVACLLVGSLAAACSSSAKKADSSSNQPTTTTTAKSSDSGSGSSDGNSAAAAGAGILSSSDCTAAAVAYTKMLAAPAAALSGNKTDTSDLNAEYAALQSKIPSSLKSEYATVGAAYAQFAKDVKDGGISGLAKAGQDMGSAKVSAASQKISDYFNNHCQS